MASVEVEVVAVSTTGPVRDRNEDHVGVVVLGDADSAVIPASEARHAAMLGGPGVGVAVADGLGGHAGGHLASRHAIRLLLDGLAAQGAAERVSGLVRSVYEQANATLFAGELAREAEDPPRSGSSSRYRDAQTTLTTLVVTPRDAYVAHVGDSRLYRLRDDTLELLTRDHSQAMELLRMRVIRPDQARQHPGRHVLTRSVGGDIAVRIDVRSGPASAGDAYLLCSDGLWSGVTDSEIADALDGDLQAGVARLLERSLEREGDDNASVVALRILGLDQPDDAGNGSGRRPLWRRIRGG